jgi:tetratricopeptide (TPR) repeat protein
MWTEECRALAAQIGEDLAQDRGDLAACHLEQAYRLDHQDEPSVKGLLAGRGAVYLWNDWGSPDRALALLLDIRSRWEKAEDGHALTADQRISLHGLDLQIRQQWLIACDGLDQLAGEMLALGRQGAPGGMAAASYFAGSLEARRGRLPEAVAHLQRAWADHSGGNFDYFHCHRIAYLAAMCCLKQGDVAAADQWMAKTVSGDEEELNCSTREGEAVLYGIARALVLGDAADASVRANAAAYRQPSRQLELTRARAYIADSADGDQGRSNRPETEGMLPIDRRGGDHPAWALLTKRFRRESPAHRFDRRLAIADLRLQAVLHCIGLPPARFTWTAVELAGRPDTADADAGDLLDRAERAVKAAIRASTRIDQALHSTWRARQVAPRAQLLEDLRRSQPMVRADMKGCR